ncbi:MAG: hypothetical protein QM679_10960 [Patulibacter sp.]
MDTRTSTPQPWWAEVEHLRSGPETGRHQAVPSSARRSEHREQRPAGRERLRSERTRTERGRATGVVRSSRVERPAERPDWFAQEARDMGRRDATAASAAARPRATLVDVAPAHTLVHRAPQTRRRAGERPTVTITGRPEAALPPRPAELSPVPAARARERVSAVVASPDRMILWAVALGLLMIVASVATAGAGA